jgi:hypothetical protein
MIQDARPPDPREIQHDSLPTHQLLTLHDPTFHDMYEWLTLFAKDDGQHCPQHSTVQTAVSDTLPDFTTVQTMDVDALEPVTTTPKQARSPSLSPQESSK